MDEEVREKLTERLLYDAAQVVTNVQPLRQWWERQEPEPRYLWVPGLTLIVKGTAAEPEITQHWERRDVG